MPWKIRAYACEDCGKWTIRNRKSTDPYICVECGVDRKQWGRPLADRPWVRTQDGDDEVSST